MPKVDESACMLTYELLMSPFNDYLLWLFTIFIFSLVALMCFYCLYLYRSYKLKRLFYNEYLRVVGAHILQMTPEELADFDVSLQSEYAHWRSLRANFSLFEVVRHLLSFGKK